jgi:hypothetical protein
VYNSRAIRAWASVAGVTRIENGADAKQSTMDRLQRALEAVRETRRRVKSDRCCQNGTWQNHQGDQEEAIGTAPRVPGVLR